MVSSGLPPLVFSHSMVNRQAYLLELTAATQVLQPSSIKQASDLGAILAEVMGTRRLSERTIRMPMRTALQLRSSRQHQRSNRHWRPRAV